VAGGREIWGLPKELADFELEKGRATVRKDGRPLLSLTYEPGSLSLGSPLLLPAWGLKSGGPAHFSARGSARITPGKASWESSALLPIESGSGRCLVLSGLKMLVGAPSTP
jgi:hypothetical protein